MAGKKALRSIRIGRETTAGTAVPALKYWRGTGTLEDTRETVFVEEDVGYLCPLDRAYTPRLGAAIALDSTPATFEQLPYILTCGVKQDTAGEVDGSGFIYTFTFPELASNTLDTLTIEGGDDQAAEEAAYMFCRSFALEGNAGEALMMSAEMVGRQVTASAFTTTATIPTVEEILFGKGAVYLDAVTGTMGTTPVAATIKGVRLNVNTGIQTIWTISDEQYFGSIDQGRSEISCDLTFAHNATAVTEIANWRAETPRQLRLQWNGAALATAGTTFTTKALRVDLVGVWEKFSKIDEEDGLDIVTGTFRVVRDATAAKFAEIKICNLNSTMGI
ncbi:MAG: hypothetical protein WC485_02835 [Opitutaceae bacterium]